MMEQCGKKQLNRQGIRCVAYYRNDTTLATISRWIYGDSSLLAENLAIKAALDMALYRQ